MYSLDYLGKLALFFIQRILLNISYYFFKIFNLRGKIYSYCIGVEEIAGFNNQFKSLFENSFNVALNYNYYYGHQYNFKASKNTHLRYMQRLFFSPILLGFLLNRSENFIYFWNTGYLLNHIDNRKHEFKFLKKKNKFIMCIFLGSDIRSIKLLKDYGDQKGYDTIGNLVNYQSGISAKNETFIQKTAVTTEEFADLIFTAEVDQLSYFTKKVYFPNYICNDKDIHFKDINFDFNNNIKILHAPTNPYLKGTMLIRAAIIKLKKEGYKFEYLEPFNKSNNEVLTEMKSTHIVINQLYAFVPSVLGIEAMANNCCLVTSADRNIEKSLPVGSNKAWLVTKYWEIYENLKYLLDNPKEIKLIADLGTKYVVDNFSLKPVKDYYLDKINTHRINKKEGYNVEK